MLFKGSPMTPSQQQKGSEKLISLPYNNELLASVFRGGGSPREACASAVTAQGVALIFQAAAAQGMRVTEPRLLFGIQDQNWSSYSNFLIKH